MLYAQDHLGSVRDLVNASGSGLASYDYDPYGQPTRSTTNGSARADYRYAGLFYHAPSGLYLTHYRAYDPVTARWLSRDPIGEMGGVNLYAYVSNNPLRWTDPTGLKRPYDENYGPGGGNCSHYSVGGVLYYICNDLFGDGPWTNCSRKCLKDYYPGRYDGPWQDYGFWLFPQHPVCWWECTNDDNKCNK